MIHIIHKHPLCRERGNIAFTSTTSKRFSYIGVLELNVELVIVALSYIVETSYLESLSMN
ncbi:MAG: hypothetical protein N3E36_07355 [Sulfolobales archaeon]|nr:hypothetical protein [Ignisphaera sp.]MCX8199808.1 hypothetical protein [Sulfolobales archaeon]MDW8084952.1 hypothetical protein [Ignisphaera sp.]